MDQETKDKAANDIRKALLDRALVRLDHSLQMWVLLGRAPGSFLTAVLCNDLKEAYNRADQSNTAAMPRIVGALTWGLPAQSWGSVERFDAWAEHRGMQGL